MSKEKFQLEFPIHASPAMLFQYFATPSGLGEWFADNVNSRGKIFTFIWDDSEEVAKLVSSKADERARYHWVEDEDDAAFFEFKIQVDALTKDVSLMITDFAYPEDMEESKMLWENQINELKHIIGA